MEIARVAEHEGLDQRRQLFARVGRMPDGGIATDDGLALQSLAPDSVFQRRCLVRDVGANLVEAQRQEAETSCPPRERLARARAEVKARAARDHEGTRETPVHQSFDEQSGIIEVLDFLEEYEGRIGDESRKVGEKGAGIRTPVAKTLDLAIDHEDARRKALELLPNPGRLAGLARAYHEECFLSRFGYTGDRGDIRQAPGNVDLGQVACDVGWPDLGSLQPGVFPAEGLEEIGIHELILAGLL